MKLIRNILWAAVLFTGALAAQSVLIQLENGVVQLRGWIATTEPVQGWPSILTLQVDAPDSPAMLGTYSVDKQALTFRPRFPLSAGMTYLAEANLPDGRKLTSRIAIPAADLHSEAHVEHVYPSVDVLPSNILKLYIHFSAPMSRGEAWQRIHLLDSDGKPVPLAFLELDQELWDASGKRLTVLFDPGRIKRGLVPGTESGSAITEGRSYRLVIDKNWHDGKGAVLTAGFEKGLKGAPSIRTVPEPKRWQVEAPAVQTTSPLVIRFPVPMDSALLERMIRIDGVDGTVAIGDQEREWRFTPTQPWHAGTYKIIADNTLEDITGNHLDRLFDVDLASTPARNGTSSGTSALAFTVK